ncbi:syntaxin 6, N-terminal-domain-containing protein [Cladochytrium replicatum]|nr:syntaxin 6, N-terminal-domain-containing protein [Cladochytrium replicatum]
MSNADPFFAVKDEVEMSLANASQLYQNWSRLHDSTSSQSRNPQQAEELKWTAHELHSSLTSIEMDLRDLDETVRIVEANPGRFRLGSAEVRERRAFVSRTRQTVSDMKRTVDNPPKRGTTAAAPATNSGGKSAGAKGTTGVGSGGRFVDHEMDTQMSLFRQQDAQMDDVAQTVGGLREVALVMGRELDDQTHLLEEMELQVDTTAGKLKVGMRKMQEVIKANADNKQLATICILIVVIIFLILAIIYF